MDPKTTRLVEIFLRKRQEQAEAARLAPFVKEIDAIAHTIVFAYLNNGALPETEIPNPVAPVFAQKIFVKRTPIQWAHLERELILATLEDRKGNRTETAKTLGISLRGLRLKLHEYAGWEPDTDRDCHYIGLDLAGEISERGEQLKALFNGQVINAEPRIVPSQFIRANIGRTLADVERDFILATLIQHQGNRTHAANVLDISIRTMRNKLNEYKKIGAVVPPPVCGIAA